MTDPLDPVPPGGSGSASSYEVGRPRPKKGKSIWVVVVVMLFLVLVVGYLMMHSRHGTDPAPAGPRARKGSVPNPAAAMMARSPFLNGSLPVIERRRRLSD